MFDTTSDQDPAVRKYDLRSVRHVLCGAAPLSPEMSSLLLDLFPEAQVGQIYGYLFSFLPLLTPYFSNSALDNRIDGNGYHNIYATCPTSSRSAWKRRAAFTRCPRQRFVFSCRIHSFLIFNRGKFHIVVKDDGSLAAAGEPGELYVSSPSLALGYHNDDAAYVVHLVHTKACCRLI